MAGNLQSSRGLPNGAPQRGHGGTLSVLFANTELPVSRQYATYDLEGSGQITKLTPLPQSFKFEIVIKSGNPTFINSARLTCPSGVNYVGAVGDLIILRSDGDGVWRLFAIPNSSMVPSAFPTFTGTLAAAAINASGAIGGLTVSAGTPATGITAGDLSVARSSSTGVIYLDSSGSNYLYNNGTAFSFNGRPVNVANAIASTSITTGALTVGGGLGVAGAINVGGPIKSSSAANTAMFSNKGQSNLTIPTGSAATIFSGPYAVMFITDVLITGATAVFILAGSASQLISTTGGGVFVAGTTPATNQISVGYSGGVYVVVNNHPGGTVGIRTQIFEMS